jgi:hypothetical protein
MNDRADGSIGGIDDSLPPSLRLWGAARGPVYLFIFLFALCCIILFINAICHGLLWRERCTAPTAWKGPINKVGFDLFDLGGRGVVEGLGRGWD